LYLKAFSKMSEVEFKKLLNLAKWNTVPENTVLIKQNTIIDSVIIIYSGIAKVESNGKIIAYLNEGNFAGEMSFITNERTNAQIETITELEYLSISRANITKLMNSSEEFKESINQILNMDLIKKLKTD
jgi:CRP-like cAMP-binding protein